MTRILIFGIYMAIYATIIYGSTALMRICAHRWPDMFGLNEEEAEEVRLIKETKVKR